VASSSTKIAVRAAASVAELDAAAWDGLIHGASPFLRHGFLRALEESGSIDPAGRTAGGRKRRSGWSSLYLLAEQAGRLVGAVPAFLKEHSYGEYIFDWGWASAAQRAGLRYYPKLVVAAPATPATGHRKLIAPGADADAVRADLIAAVRAVADDTECSSIHWLFCTADEQAALAEAGYFARASMQFHWRNRGYATFDDFLAQLKSRKRKQLRKERDKARAAIERKLPLFEAGAQGEHKLLRGFEPSRTYSAHWMRHEGLAAAVEDFTQREAQAMDVELAEMAKYGPYRSDNGDE
jgi:predicted N-acyltransferase